MRHYQPFLFTFAEQPIKNTIVPDADVQRRWNTRELKATPVVPVAEREEALLVDVAAHPISTITQRYERLAWNAKIGNTIKDAVIARGLATFESVSTPTARVKILTLTRAGEEYLTSRAVDLTRTRHGGIEHEYWKWAIKQRLERQNYTVIEEEPVGGGKTVDLHATKGTDELWIEVETGRSDVPANIAKCNALQGRVVFVFTNAADRDQHRSRIRAEWLTSAELDQL